MTATPALHPWRDRATGTLLAAAVGDALGWPYERRDRTRTLTETPSPGGFFAWDRFAGSRQQRITEHINAGDYSDDTQMTIAVARARLTAGKQWQAWLERVEWPFLLDYERGAGASVKAACRAWSRGHAPWDGPASAAARYFATGANGAAMRIAPHVLIHHQDLRFDELAVDVIRDAATTHGHPRALLGAVMHAYALWVSLREPAPLPYGWLIDTLLADAEQWQQPFWRMLPEAWQDRAASQFDTRFDRVWLKTTTEVEQLLTAAERELKEGAVSAPTVFLTKQGLTFPIRVRLTCRWCWQGWWCGRSFLFPGPGVGWSCRWSRSRGRSRRLEVARAVRAKNYGRQVPLPVAVRDRLGELFPDHEFSQAFGATGPAGWSPGVWRW